MGDPLGAEEVRRALAEDRAREDVTTALLGSSAAARVTGVFLAEERFVVAGFPVAARVFRELDPAVEVEVVVDEGAWVEPGARLATVRGPACALLAGERTALNFLQRLSGIATLTRHAVDAVAGTAAQITDTRKTAPGLRALEKYAVRVGGGVNHRTSLADQVLFKDNHWALLGARSLGDVLGRVPTGIPVVVEVETEAQFTAALEAGVTRVLVDNLASERVAAWVQRCGAQVAVEASGGITPERAGEYARAGARYVSIGALTHSARAVAISLAIAPE